MLDRVHDRFLGNQIQMGRADLIDPQVGRHREAKLDVDAEMCARPARERRQRGDEAVARRRRGRQAEGERASRLNRMVDEPDDLLELRQVGGVLAADLAREAAQQQ